MRRNVEMKNKREKQGQEEERRGSCAGEEEGKQ
jgi:hypothetical protein